MLSRKVPPRCAVTTIMPALGGPWRTCVHSSSVKSASPVISVLLSSESLAEYPSARRHTQSAVRSPHGKRPGAAIALCAQSHIAPRASGVRLRVEEDEDADQAPARSAPAQRGADHGLV